MNAPGFFSLIWRVAEPMLSPTTRRKIRLLHNKQVLPAAPSSSEPACLRCTYQTAEGLHMLRSMSAPVEDSRLYSVSCVFQ